MFCLLAALTSICSFRNCNCFVCFFIRLANSDIIYIVLDKNVRKIPNIQNILKVYFLLNLCLKKTRKIKNARGVERCLMLYWMRGEGYCISSACPAECEIGNILGRSWKKKPLKGVLSDWRTWAISTIQTKHSDKKQSTEPWLAGRLILNAPSVLKNWSRGVCYHIRKSVRAGGSQLFWNRCCY